MSETTKMWITLATVVVGLALIWGIGKIFQKDKPDWTDEPKSYPSKDKPEEPKKK